MDVLDNVQILNKKHQLSGVERAAPGTAKSHACTLKTTCDQPPSLGIYLRTHPLRSNGIRSFHMQGVPRQCGVEGQHITFLLYFFKFILAVSLLRHRERMDSPVDFTQKCWESIRKPRLLLVLLLFIYLELKDFLPESNHLIYWHWGRRGRYGAFFFLFFSFFFGYSYHPILILLFARGSLIETSTLLTLLQV